jgi:adenosylhomocysteine nucleosidase
MEAVVLISANLEWRATRPLFPEAKVQESPLGEWLEVRLPAPKRQGAGARTGMLSDLGYPIVAFHGGWGKIAAAASAQYVIDRWNPPLLINLGTCGGFRGHIEQNEVVLVEKTLVYDIVEQMTDPAEALAHYTTTLDLSWLKDEPPQTVRRTLMVSGDRDLIASEVPMLHERFGAVAGDWESGAIAWVAARNGTRCLILRGVSDLVGPGAGDTASASDAYDGDGQFFAESAGRILQNLFETLPAWIQLAAHS